MLMQGAGRTPAQSLAAALLLPHQPADAWHTCERDPPATPVAAEVLAQIAAQGREPLCRSRICFHASQSGYYIVRNAGLQRHGAESARHHHGVHWQSAPGSSLSADSEQRQPGKRPIDLARGQRSHQCFHPQADEPMPVRPYLALPVRAGYGRGDTIEIPGLCWHCVEVDHSESA
jgi:hypothetical protein